jgi:hypothetical protein
VLRLLAHHGDKRRAELISHEGAGPEEAATRRRVWCFGLAYYESLLAVSCSNYIISFSLHPSGIDFPKVVIIFYEHYF